MARILIIEDETAIAELEKDYLELSDFEVVLESDGSGGAARALDEDFDLIILDLMLPGMNGFDICKLIRETKNTPIIMVSAKSEDIDKIRGLGLGADDYMTKPFSPGELVARVKAHIDPEHLKEAQRMADKVTAALTGAGIWGVEFFLSHENGVYFSELSPRPHDTGMVTLAGTQNLNEFELHLRAVLGLPIPEITQERIGASAVILSPIASKEAPRYRGEEEVCKETNTYLRIFGKPYTKLNRRMGVVVCYAPNGSDLDALRDKCKAAAAKVEVY